MFVFLVKIVLTLVNKIFFQLNYFRKYVISLYLQYK